MPDATIIGRIAVKVLPDTTSFRRDAQRQLDEVEKRLKAEINLVPDATGFKQRADATIKEAQARLSNLKVKMDLDQATAARTLTNIARDFDSIQWNIKPEVSRADAEHVKRQVEALIEKIHLLHATITPEMDDLSRRRVEREIEDLKHKINNLKATIEPDVGEIQKRTVITELAILARDRIVKLIPEVSKTAAAKARATLAALSGGRLLHKTFEDFSEFFKNLDRNLPKIGALALGLASVASWGLTASANLLALGSSLASIGGASLALPGILAGIGVGLFTTIHALKDMKNALPGVYKQWQKLGHQITKDFWSKASNGIRQLATVYMPHLGDAAKQVGQFWGTLAHELSKPFHNALGPMFDNLKKSIQITTAHSKSFAGIITKLGLTGSSYLPRLARWFSDIADTFNRFLNRARKDGTLQRWIDNGISALKQLGQVLKNTYNIFSGLNDAAKKAGGSTLSIFAGTLGRISAVVNSPSFQHGLTDVFQSAFQAMHAIAVQAGPAVKSMFRSLGSTMSSILPAAGRAVGELAKAVAQVLGSHAVQQGLKSLFSGLEQGIHALMPGIRALAPLFGQLGKFIGELAKDFAPLLTAAFRALAPIVRAVMRALQPVIRLLSGSLRGLITDLTPALRTLANALLGMAKPIVSALGPALRQILPQFAKLVTTLVNGLAPFLPQFGKMFAQALTSLTPLVTELLKLMTDVLKPLMPLLVSVFKNNFQTAIDIMTTLAKVITPLLKLLDSLINKLTKLGGLGGLSGLIPGLGGLGGGGLNPLNQIKSLGKGFVDLGHKATSAWHSITTTTTDGVGHMSDASIAGQAIFKGVGRGIGDAARDIANSIQNSTNAAKRFDDALSNLGTGSLNTAQAELSFQQSLKSMTSAAKDTSTALKGNSEAALTNRQNVLGALQAAKEHAQALKDQGKSAGVVRQALLDDVNALIKHGDAANFDKGQLRDLIKKAGLLPGQIKGALSTTGDVGKTAGRALADGVTSGINGGKSKAKSAAQSVASGIKAAMQAVSLFNVGQTIINGLNAGLQAAVPNVKSTLGGLTNDMPKWKGPAPKDRKLLFGVGKLIMQGLIDGFVASFSKIQNRLQNLTEQIHQITNKGVRKALLADVKQYKDELKRFDKVSTKLDNAKRKLKNLEQAARDYAASIKQGIVATGDLGQVDVSGQSAGEGTFNFLVKNLKKSRTQAKSFAADLKKLKKLGLNKTQLDEFAQEGPAALQQMRAILSQGKDGVKEVNRLQRQIAKSAAKAAAVARNAMFENGIQAAKGLVKGLKDNLSEIEKVMKHIAEQMVKVIKKELGIHSPSRVFAEIGGHIGTGLLSGLESMYGKVHRSLSTFAGDIAAIEFAAPTLSGQVRAASVGAYDNGGGSAGQVQKVFNYYAAPGKSLPQEDVFAATQRSRFAW